MPVKMQGRPGYTGTLCRKCLFVKIFASGFRVAVLACALWGALATTAAAAVPPVFVLNSLEANISVIDPQTWQETARIPTGKEPHHLYLTPDEKSLIVANALGDTLTFVDPLTAQVQRTVRGIVDPYHLRFTPDMKWLITAANRLNHVDFYRWDGKDLTLTPELSGMIWTTYKLPYNFTIGAGPRYQESVFVNAANTLKVPSYTVFDAMVQYDLNEDIKLRLNIYNLLDREYRASVNNNGQRYNPGAPISAMFTTEFKF